MEDISEEQLIAEIHRLHDELKKVSSYQEMNDHGEYSVYTYSRVFGSWNEAVESARYSSRPNPTSRSKMNC
jgi:peptidoglycan/xylan/chitin deacetylase (PgdA/CDA1 family)